MILKVCTFKLRNAAAFAAVVVFAAAAVIFAAARKSTDVFFVNGREVPIYSVERQDNKIALTFDCAWNDDDIDEILAALEKYNCRATFFAVGDWAEKYPDALKKINDAGHEIGNHSYKHDDYTKMSAEEITADLDRCDKTIEEIIGKKPSLMRAPSGGYNDTVVKAAQNSGRMYIQWSVDGIDYGDAEKKAIYNRVVSKTKNGDIILLHNGTKNTAKILPEILEKLGDKFEFATVSELIYVDNYIIDNNGRQFPK
jgi:polysaccharide deacetylase family sporulation protein PdaB